MTNIIRFLNNKIIFLLFVILVKFSLVHVGQVKLYLILNTHSSMIKVTRPVPPDERKVIPLVGRINLQALGCMFERCSNLSAQKITAVARCRFELVKLKFSNLLASAAWPDNLVIS